MKNLRLIVMKNTPLLGSKSASLLSVTNPVFVVVFSSNVLFTILCLLSCTKQEPSTMTNAATTSLSLKVNEQKTLTIGETSKKNVTIKFLGVTEERCPREDCSLCYGGYVFAKFNIVVNDQSKDSLILQRISCIPAEDIKPDSQTSSKKQVGGLDITLLNITELTKANPVSVNDYVVKLFISTP